MDPRIWTRLIMKIPGRVKGECPLMGVVKYLMDYWTMQERAASQTSITEGTPLISPGKRRISKIRIKISRKCLHTFLVPIELCVLFFYFGNHFQAQVNRQYYFQAIMKDKIRNFYNATYDNFTNESLHSCLNQDHVVNITDEMTFNEGQTEVNTLTLVTTITDDLTRIVTALVLGSLSDRFGRKIFIVMTFFGGFVGAIVNTILFYFNLNLWLFVVISFVTRLFGGDTLLMACSFAYVADITSQRWLTVRIGILEAFKFVAEGFAAAAANKWMDKTDCDDRLLAVLILVVFFVGLVYSFFIAESLVLNAKVRHKWKSKSVQSMTRGVKLLFMPSYLSWSNLWKFWVGLMIILVGEASGIHHIMNFFLHNKPLEWSYDIIGNYSIAISASKFVSLLIFLPLLVVMRIPDTVIMLIGGILDCGMNIFIALLTTTWEMFLAGVILSFNAIVSPSLRSYVKRLIDENDKGVAFSIMASFKVLSNVISATIFNEIYKPGKNKGFDVHNPKLIFWLSAGLRVIMIVLIILLIIFPIKTRNTNIELKNKDMKAVQSDSNHIQSDLPNIQQTD